MRLYLQPLLFLILCLFGLNGTSLAQGSDPPVTSEATASGGYTMTGGNGNHTWVETEVDEEGGYVTKVLIDDVEHVWDPEGRRYYVPGVTPPNFAYYQFYEDGAGGYTYEHKVPTIGGTTVIERGTLTPS